MGKFQDFKCLLILLTMLKRILYFSKPYHLNTKNEQLIITNKENGEIKQAPIEDIGFAVFDHPQITFTQSVVQILAENNTAIVFCDKKHHPSSLLYHLDSNTVQSEIFRHQINASEPLKKNLWKQTIEAKIKNQAALIKKIGRDESQIHLHSQLVKSGDTDNREAQAARLYWKRLFSEGFKRERYGMPPNPSLNYGYAILRAAVARALSASGLLPTLGIHHHNKYNAYCLADDIMEPYRPFVDECVLEIKKNNPDYHIIDKNQKATLLNILNKDVYFENINRPLMVGLSITTASLARCFNGKTKKLLFPSFK